MAIVCWIKSLEAFSTLLIKGKIGFLKSNEVLVSFKVKQHNCVIENINVEKSSTVWKVSKYGTISDPYFPLLGLNTGKYGPEITPYLDTFQAV